MTAHRVAVGAEVRMVEPPGRGTMDGLLEYRTSAPFEVRVTMSDASGRAAMWVWSREVMDAATRTCTPVGDHQVIMCSVGGPDLLVRLNGDPSMTGNTSCVLALPLATVRRFLALTFELVPRGTESGHLDLDGELRALLDAN